MKYPDEWSMSSVLAAMAVAVVAIGLFNVYVWFDATEHPPLWWLASPIALVVAGSSGVVRWFVSRRRPPDSGPPGSRPPGSGPPE